MHLVRFAEVPVAGAYLANPGSKFALVFYYANLAEEEGRARIVSWLFFR